jgi:hypothetical protein
MDNEHWFRRSFQTPFHKEYSHGNPVANQRSETIEDTVGDAISTIANEIAGLDNNIGFDETINLDETVDMQYKIDA